MMIKEERENEKEPLVPIGYEDVWAPKPVLSPWRREKSCLCRE
jgi:hypothetical protein